MNRPPSDAVAARAFAPEMAWWDAGDGDGVAYYATGSSWVAVGAPLAPADRVADVARRFVTAAADKGQRSCFFGVEQAIAGLETLEIGEQPFFEVSGWEATLERNRSLREQIARARRKGVVIRRAEASDLAESAPVRVALDRAVQAWSDERPMEPLGFVVRMDPLRVWDPGLQLVAIVDGVLMGFLSAVYLAGSRTWLVEHIIRTPETPNGCTELMLDTVMRHAQADDRVTLGLAPLAGDASWQRFMRVLTRPLYDFEGLFQFKTRLHPNVWRPVWLAYPRGRSALVAIVDSLRAFAQGRLITFGLRTLWRRPGAAPFALAVPLVPWTIFLFVLAGLGKVGPLGFSGSALWGFAVFDIALVAGMFRAAHAPTRRLLALLWVAASLDAIVSVTNIVHVGLGAGVFGPIVRVLATAAPLIAVIALVRSMMTARR